MQERVVVTGMGTINALGHNAVQTWENAVNGVSGVGLITQFDTSNYGVKFGCEVKDYSPENFIPAREARRRDRFEQFATIAAQEAISQSGLEVSEESCHRVGVIVSSAIGGLHTLTDTVRVIDQDGPRRISPFVIPMLMANGAAGLIAIDYSFKGPCFSVASACASGIDSIGAAWMLLRTGAIDCAVTGASEAVISDIGVGSFDRLGAMSRRNQDFSMTPQPFDLNRDGLVIGEGAAILVLEIESHARRRGAEILAEVTGYAATADAFHITAPAEDGAGGAQAIRKALNSARLNPTEVSYLNAHGTATPLNDVSETRAIKAALGEWAYNIPVSSTKSMTGHMMGATGALETIFCIQATRANIVPPTIHYQTPDPECDLDYVPNQARECEVRVALNNAFGFGGHNSVLVVQKYQ